MYASSRQLSDVPGARVDRRWLVGKSARRVARRILSRSNVRSGSLGPGLRFMPLPIIRLLRDYYSEDLLDTFAPFLSFFFFARSACVARCLFCKLGVEDSNEDKLIPFSVFQFSTRERLLVKNLRRASAFRIYSRFGIDVHHCRGWISSLCFFSVTTGKTELWIEYTRRVVCCFKDSLHLGYDGISRMSRVMF